MIIKLSLKFYDLKNDVQFWERLLPMGKDK